MTGLTSLCVYCGSSSTVDPVFLKAATTLGRALGERGITVVYGGGRVGLMGLVADAAISAGGVVIGVIPAFLRRLEVGHGGVTELIVVETMHERKRIMADRADGFAILPGGFGTLEEFFEVLTWRQLGLHDKPIFIVDIDGYWRELDAVLEGIITRGFAKPSTRRNWHTVDGIGGLLQAMEHAGPATIASRTELT